MNIILNYLEGGVVCQNWEASNTIPDPPVNVPGSWQPTRGETASHDACHLARVERVQPELGAGRCGIQLLALDDAAFRKRFAGTPVKRTGRDRVMRNALIAAGNSGDPSLMPAVERLLDDASPLVRAMAVWALQRLAEPEHFARIRRLHSATERDMDVQAEWRWASPEQEAEQRLADRR
jgi:hypothetical protein